jgi:hypothetical protein
MRARRTIAALAAVAALGLAASATTASAAPIQRTAAVNCSTLPTAPATVTPAMAQAAATCTPDSGLAPLTTRQCPAIQQDFPTGDSSTWLSATTWYLYPGTPDTCDSRAAVQEIRNLGCASTGDLANPRVQWIDSGGAYHYAPTAGINALCFYPTVYNETQYVLSAGFPSYAFYLRLQFHQTAGSAMDCQRYPCVALLRK